MVPATRAARPIDLFQNGDHIEVTYGRSKHYGRTGIVTRVCNPRLSVRFDDGQAGCYVDFRYARVLPVPDPTTRINDDRTRDAMTTVSEDADDEEGNLLIGLMENLAIQTAVSVLAEANDMADVEKAIAEQAVHIRTQAWRILQRHNNLGET